MLWAVVTAALLLGPPPPPPAVEDWPGPLMFLVGQADKLVHAGLFGVGAHVLTRSLASIPSIPSIPAIGAIRSLGRGRALAFGVAASFVYGVILEGAQSTLPQRTASVGDAVADLAGGLLYAAFRRRREAGRRGGRNADRNADQGADQGADRSAGRGAAS